MKHTYQYLKLAVSAAVMAMLFSGTVLGAGKEGPGMAEGQPVAGLQTGGVIRRDSGERKKKQKAAMERQKIRYPRSWMGSRISRRFCGLPGRTDL